MLSDKFLPHSGLLKVPVISLNAGPRELVRLVEYAEGLTYLPALKRYSRYLLQLLPNLGRRSWLAEKLAGQEIRLDVF
jgi:hypothetical protein